MQKEAFHLTLQGLALLQVLGITLNITLRISKLIA